jgi:hypothetical protein
LAILVTVLIVVVGGVAAFGYWIVHEENSPGERPVPTIMRRRGKIIRKTMPGDPCSCGGTLEESGIVSPRFGELLRCGDCRRRWTIDGRRVMARRRPRRPGERPAPLEEVPGPAPLGSDPAAD